MMIKSLHARKHQLANQKQQVDFLEKGAFKEGIFPPFQQKISEQGFSSLQPIRLEILQLNVGYLCNQVCKHCHVDAGPDRKEIMNQWIMQACLEVVNDQGIGTVDITGGAPEMNPHFRWLVEALRKTTVQEIIVRSNLTILTAHKKYEDLPVFFKKNQVRIVSSLPFYEESKTDRQRGQGVFHKSVEALHQLNAVGYGKPGSNLILDLVYNPSGAYLPGSQEALERDFKKELREKYNVEFNNLFTITNIPISRFLDFLIETDNYEEYMEKLIAAFNPAALTGVMCRNTLSVDWQGYLYDCDFNQMLGMKVSKDVPSHITEFNHELIQNRNIALGQHCYACTAGAGSSCQGTIVAKS